MNKDVPYKANRDMDTINDIFRINFRYPRSCENCTHSKPVVAEVAFGAGRAIVDWRCERYGISFGMSGDSLDEFVCDNWSDE